VGIYLKMMVFIYAEPCENNQNLVASVFEARLSELRALIFKTKIAYLSIH